VRVCDLRWETLGQRTQGPPSRHCIYTGCCVARLQGCKVQGCKAQGCGVKEKIQGAGSFWGFEMAALTFSSSFALSLRSAEHAWMRRGWRGGGKAASGTILFVSSQSVCMCKPTLHVST